MKIMHTADWHLDRMFEGITYYPPNFQDIIVAANQKAFENMIQLAIDEQVDLVLFAGDTFHQAQITLATQHFFVAGLRRLGEYDIQAVISFGNHDFYQAKQYWFSFPKNVTVFTSDDVEIKDVVVKNERVQIVGFSYLQAAEVNEKTLEFPARTTTPIIGMYHGALGVAGDRYAPFQLEQLRRLNYDYFALGHIHVPDVLQKRPPIIYSGTPIGHNKKENQVQGVVLFDLASPEDFHFVDVAPVKFTTMETTISGEGLPEILAEIKHTLQEATTKTWQICQLNLTLNQAEKEFSASFESGEVLRYLQDFLAENKIKIALQTVTVKNVEQGQLTLPLSADVLKNYRKLYDEEDVFKQAVRELLANYDINQLVGRDASFKKEVLDDAVALIQHEFSFTEARDEIN